MDVKTKLITLKKYYKENRKIILIYLILYIISLLVRIPRVTGVISTDGFEILWMGQALSFGLNEVNTWLINPASYLGFYPFSFYPIGYPFLISLYLRLGFTIETTSFLISYVWLTIAILGCIKLSKILFEKKKYQIIFVSSYIFAPIFLRFTYFTFNARAPLIALTPWFIYFLEQCYVKINTKNIIGLAITSFLMIFFHRLWLAFVPIILIYVFSKILQKKPNFIKKIFSNKKLFLILYLILVIALLVSGYFFIGVDSRKITSPWFDNTNPFGLLINLIIDYGLRIGLLSLFFPIGIIKYIYPSIIENRYTNSDISNDIKDIPVKELLIILFLSFLWTYTVYTTVVYLYIFLFISISGFKVTEEKLLQKYKNYLYLGIVLFSFLYVFLYAFLIIRNSLFSYHFIVVLGLYILFITLVELSKRDQLNFKFLPKIKKLQGGVYILLILIMSYGINTTEGLVIINEHEFPYSYISSEEIEVINKIKESGIEGIIYMSHYQLARSISGYGFLPTINGKHQPHQIYYGWITAGEIMNNSIFTIFSDSNPLSIIYNGIIPEDEILDTLLETRANTTEGLNIIEGLKVQYALVLKSSNGSIYPYHITGYGIYSDPVFLYSLVDLPYFYETEHLFLWKFY